MAIDPALVGKTYPPGRVYEVGREKIREFADAIGDPNPAYRDPEAAKAYGHPDVVAPPTFPIVFSFGATDHLIEDPSFNFALHRLLHGEQRFSYNRPIVAGDRLVSTLSVTGIRKARDMDVVSSRTDITTEEGELVCTTYSTLFHRPEESA